MPAPGSINIVHVVRQFHPGIGGLENFVEQLSLRQGALGHNVKVVTLDRIFSDADRGKLAADEQLSGVGIRRISFTGSPRYPLAPAVLSALKGADIVHVHAVDFFCDFLAATSPLHRKKMVLSTHGGFFHTGYASRLKTLYFGSVTRLSLGQYGAVIACSTEDERIFRPISDDKLVLINNPVDIDKFAGLARAGTKTIIYFGRIAPNKQVERLVDWFAGLAAADPEWRLIVAGKPTGPELGSLVRHITALELDTRVSVHDSPSNEALAALIGRSSVYACASSYEGFGLAAVEAASAGLFPVLSKIPPFEDTLQRLGYGMSVDFERPETWAKDYDELTVRTASFGAQYDAAAVRGAVAQFDWAAAAPAFVEVYRQVLGHAKRRIGKVKVDVLGRDAASRTILDAIAAKRSMMVMFCNAHTVNLAQSDERLRAALADALVLNDGVGLDIASKMLFGVPFPDNLNGTDFIPFLLGATDEPIRLFMLGGAPGVAEAAAQKIEARNVNVAVVGTMNGYFGAADEAGLLDQIRRSGANLVLVAMGQPRQEHWARQHYRAIDGPVICVGALFDFMAARVRRAPAMTRKLRMEWAFRLTQEPGRLARRYLFGNVSFLVRILRQRMTGTRI